FKPFGDGDGDLGMIMNPSPFGGNIVNGQIFDFIFFGNFFNDTVGDIYIDKWCTFAFGSLIFNDFFGKLSRNVAVSTRLQNRT
ncbi:MAG: hypothetical protein AB4041_19360, partial [Microcystaceae cyanobacterium]